MAPQPKAVPQILQELWELLKAYARQETVDPLKGLGRYLGYGVGGSMLVGLGGLFLSLSLLRLLQRFSVFADTWSFAPYAIVLVTLVLAIGAIGAGIGRRKPSKPPKAPAAVPVAPSTPSGAP